MKDPIQTLRARVRAGKTADRPVRGMAFDTRLADLPRFQEPARFRKAFGSRRETPPTEP